MNLMRTALCKIVLEWPFYPIEAIKNRFGPCQDFTSKNWPSPSKSYSMSAIYQIIPISAHHNRKQNGLNIY